MGANELHDDYAEDIFVGECGDSRFLLDAAGLVGMTSTLGWGLGFLASLGIAIRDLFRLASLRRDSRGGCLYVVRSESLKPSRLSRWDQHIFENLTGVLRAAFCIPIRYGAESENL